jgi:hypothetical protein
VPGGVALWTHLALPVSAGLLLFGSSSPVTGAQFEIAIDGKPHSYRDTKAVAMEAAQYLKAKHPNSEVTVKDLTSGAVTVVAYKPA